MIFFRADGNSKIGAGHIMRCLSIADAARDMSEDVRFYTADDAFSRTFSDRNINHTILGADFMKMESELVLFKSEILKYKPSAVIVDSYYVTKDYLWSLLNCCHSYGAKLVYIDDVLSFAYPCDYLVNYNIYGAGRRKDYHDLYNTIGLKEGDKGFPVFLLGLKYVPLRKEFFNISHGVKRENPKDILISTGGADTEHVAVEVVRHILNLKKNKIDDYTFHILVGAMNQDKNEIRKLASKNSNIKIHYNVKNMARLISQCDVAVSAAGSTLYELCAMHTTTITYTVADNQIAGANEFSKNGTMDYIGDVRNVGRKELAKKIVESALSAIKNIDYSNNMACQCDSLGAYRIVLDIVKKYGLEELQNGLCTYRSVNNNNHEIIAKKIMDNNDLKYCEFELYLIKDFLSWVKSNNWNIVTNIKAYRELIKEVFERIKKGDNRIAENIKKLSSIPMIGPAYASAILTLINKHEYGVVSKYTRCALGAKKNSEIMAILIEEYYRKLADEYGKIDSNLSTPRQIDMALWGIGKMIMHSRNNGVNSKKII